MKVEIGDSVVTVAFVALLIAGSLSAFLMFDALSAINPDAHDRSCQYYFAGTVGDDPCSGTGQSEHIASRGGYHLYSYSVSVGTGQSQLDLEFSLMFDDGDVPDQGLYTYSHKTKLNDIDVNVWTRSENGTDYTFFISEGCVLQSVVIASSDYALTGNII